MAKSKKGNQQNKQTIVETAPSQALNKKSFLDLEESICIGLLLCLIILIYNIRSKFLYMPFERDEGIYSYMGKLILEGKVPYKDFLEIKFPGLFYFYGFMVSTFGATVKGMHTGFMYMNIATIIILYNASRQLFSPIAAIITATTYAFVSLTPTLSGFTIQAEQGVAFFISLGILFYAFAKKHNKWYWYALVGFAMGSSFMIKTNGIFLCLWGGLIIITDFLFTKEKNYKELAINILGYASGGIFIVGAFFLLMFTKGVFHEMIYYTMEVPKKYIGGVTYEDGLKYFNYTKDAVIENHKFFWVQGVLAIVVCWAPSVNFKLKIFGITLLAASFLTFVPGYYFYGHYWIQAIPGLAVVSGFTYYCINSIFKTYVKVNTNIVKYIYLVVFAAFTYSHFNFLKPYYLKPNYERILRAVYGNNPFPEAMEIGNFINANSKPEDDIVLIGSEPQIYFYTNKKCPSRYAYFTALVNNTPTHKEMQREFISDVEKTKPRYFIYFDHPISLLPQQGADQYIFQWAQKYMNENYKLVGFVDMIEGQHSKYVWRDELANYKPEPNNNIFIYERK